MNTSIPGPQVRGMGKQAQDGACLCCAPRPPPCPPTRRHLNDNTKSHHVRPLHWAAERGVCCGATDTSILQHRVASTVQYLHTLAGLSLRLKNKRRPPVHSNRRRAGESSANRRRLSANRRRLSVNRRRLTSGHPSREKKKKYLVPQGQPCTSGLPPISASMADLKPSANSGPCAVHRQPDAHAPRHLGHPLSRGTGGSSSTRGGGAGSR